MRIQLLLLSLSLSLSATSAIALPIGQRVTIDLFDGPHPGTVVGYHPSTGESEVRVDGEGDSPTNHVTHWLYDKDIHVTGGAAAVPEAAAPPAQKNTTPATPQSSLQPWPKPHQPPSWTQAAGARNEQKYKVGQRVEFVQYGKWFKGIITALRDDAYAPYQIHGLGFEMHDKSWSPASFIRPPNSGTTEPVPGGEENDDLLRQMRGGPQTAATPGGGVPAKHYKAVLKVGDHQEDAAPFTITGSRTYTDSVGTQGTYSFDQASSILTFHGGNYNGARAQYEMNYGVPRLFILGKDGNRIIDCD